MTHRIVRVQCGKTGEFCTLKYDHQVRRICGAKLTVVEEYPQAYTIDEVLSQDGSKKSEGENPPSSNDENR